MSGGVSPGSPEERSGDAASPPPDSPGSAHDPPTRVEPGSADHKPPASASAQLTPLQKVAVSSVSFAGAVLVELSDGWPESVSGWLLLLVGAAFVGMVAGGFVFPRLTGLLEHLARSRPAWLPRPSRPKKNQVVVAAAVVLTVGLAYFAGPPALRALDRWVFGCPQSTELTVLTSPGGLAPTVELVEAYERWTASRDGGCPAVDAYVYATTDAKARDAVQRGWAATGDNIVNPARDVGPRPDVWLPDSDVDLARLEEPVRTREIAEDTTVAVTPVVLAVPAGVRAQLPERVPAWPELAAQADAAGLDVVRADPSVSVLANVATAALYGEAGEGRAVERVIEQALDRGNYPLLGDGPDLLCRYRRLVPPGTAVVMSERDMVRYNRGQALGGSCGVPDRPHVEDEQLVALYPQDLAVAQHLVRLRWTPEGSRRAVAVRDLQRWLADEPGRRALEEAGLRPVGEPVDPSSFTAAGAEPDPPRTPVGLVPATVDATRNAFLVARRPSRVLVALDVSGSMKEEVQPGQTRLRAVADGVRRAVTGARGNDEIGLWLFPADASGRGARRAVPVGPLDDGHRGAITDVLDRAGPDGDTPLLDTTAEGLLELGPSNDTGVAKLIVVTDGEDTTSVRKPDELLEIARTAKVRVFVITAGGTSCAAQLLKSLTADTGGRCYTEVPAGVGPRVTEIIDD